MPMPAKTMTATSAIATLIAVSINFLSKRPERRSSQVREPEGYWYASDMLQEACSWLITFEDKKFRSPNRISRIGGFEYRLVKRPEG